MRDQFMGVGLFAKSPNVTAQTRVNLYLEFTPVGDKTRVEAYGTPGLELFVDFGDTPARAHYPLGVLNYVVHRGTFWEINNAGVKTNRGSLLTTSGRCSISDNGLQIMIVDGTYGYIYTIATTTLVQITDGDFPANPTTVTFEGSYFIITTANTGRVNKSASYDGLTWDALDFVTAESNPDNLIRVEQDHGDVVLFGDLTIEFWGNTGALDFPYTRIAGANVEWGLAAKWSVTKFDNSLMFLGKNRMVEVQVVRLNGYQPQRVSTHDIENIMNSASNADATALSYLVDGHPMYQINFPSLLRSFLYDGVTSSWSELKSSGSRHRAEIGSNYLSGKYVSDYANGKIYKFRTDVYTDNGAMIVRELTGRHYEHGMDWFTVNQFILDMETGMGLASGQGSDPQVMLQYSTDNGHTWSEELWTSAGKIGEYHKRAEWWRLGRGRDFLFRVRVSDPIKLVITGVGLK
jgi:hypothetical protein